MSLLKYWGSGKYIGEELIGENGKDIKIGNDELNGVYVIQFDDGSVYDNIFEDEIIFNKD